MSIFKKAFFILTLFVFVLCSTTIAFAESPLSSATTTPMLETISTNTEEELTPYETDALINFTASYMSDAENNPDEKIAQLYFHFQSFVFHNTNDLTFSLKNKKENLYKGSVTQNISIDSLMINTPYTISFYVLQNNQKIFYSGTIRILEKNDDIQPAYLEVSKEIYAYKIITPNDQASPLSLTSGEYEPNDTTYEANHMEGDDTRGGRIYPSGDIDYYKVALGYDGKANFWLGDIPSNKDYDLYLYDSSGTLLESSATSGTSESIFNFDVVQEETYYMKVIGYNGAYSSSGTYQIRAKMVSYTHNDDYGNTYYDAINVNVGQSISARIDYPGDVDFFLLSFGTAPEVNDYNFYQVYTTGSIDTYGIFGGVSDVAYIPSEYDPIYYTMDEDDDSGVNYNFKIDYLLLPEDYTESDPNYTPYDPIMYFVKVQAYNSNASGSYTLHFEKHEDDVGDSANTAESISASSTTWKYYYLNGVDDVDYFKTVIPYNRRYKFTTSFSSDAITLEVYDENMNYLGQTSGNPEAYLQLDMYANDTYYFKVSAGVAEIACNYGFQVKTIAFLDEPDTFTPVGKPELFALTNGGHVDTTFTDAGDIDCFQFTPTQTGSYNIYTISDIDTKITLYDSDAITPLTTSHNYPDGDTDAWAARTLEEGKTYYIAVSPQVFESNQETYRIKITQNAKPNDEYFDDQWGLMNQGTYTYFDDLTNYTENVTSTIGVDCNVLPVWNFSTGENIKIGILDTGVDTSHNDLIANLSTLGTNTIHNNASVYPSGEYPVVDKNGAPIHVTAIGGHGTHVAGIAAATTNNNIGIASVAPDAEIVPIKALGSEINHSNIGVNDDGNRSTNYTVIDGINYAVQNDVKIINMSIQNFPYYSCFEDTIKNADTTLFVTISGNTATGGIDLASATISNLYPGQYNANNLITVANINSDGELASDSNYGGMTHIAAPGTDIISTFPDQKTTFWSGTSMAAPFVSGTAALIWSYYPDLTPQEVKSRIINNVTPTSALTDKVSSGGYLNAYEAFCAVSSCTQTFDLNCRETSNDELSSQAKKQHITEVKNSVPTSEKTTEFFVVFSNDSIAEEVLSQTLGDIEYEIVEQFYINEMFFIRTNSVEDADKAVDRLNALPAVVFAEPNYYITNLH